MAKKLKSNLVNMILSLLLISVFMSAALGYIYSITKGPIENSKKNAESNAIKMVVPTFNNTPEAKEIEGLTYYLVKKDDKVVGCAVKTFTDKAFSGRFDLMVGFLPDGTINKISVLSQKETPGLGTKMMDAKFYNQFENQNPSKWKMLVKKDGGQVDAISAATITSRAYSDAVQKGYDGFLKNFSTNQNDASNNDTLKKGE